jgi:hypothetical protein
MKIAILNTYSRNFHSGTELYAVIIAYVRCIENIMDYKFAKLQLFGSPTISKTTDTRNPIEKLVV